VLFIRVLLYPVVLLGSLVAAGSFLTLGYEETVLTFVVTIVAGSLVMLFQLLVPYRMDWRVTRQEVEVDLKHLFFIAILFPPLTQATCFGALTWGATQLSEWIGMHMWPSGWPLALELVLALVIGDLGFYWAHRVLHLTDWGWRIHATHHSSQKLYFFSATRVHPLNFLVTYLAPFIPLVLLGASSELLALFSVFTAVNGGLQHANIDVRLGPLNRLFATCDIHRWHHSTQMEESNTNFSSNLVLWDLVFGTYHLPNLGFVKAVGLEGSQLPQRFLAHWLSPWRMSSDKSNT
jgi:ornithine lipid hydroxylase